MTRPVADIERVAELISAGVSQAEAARRTGIPRGTLRGWIKVGPDEAIKHRREHTEACARSGVGCGVVSGAPQAPYAYLLRLYLPDQSIAFHAPGNGPVRMHH